MPQIKKNGNNNYEIVIHCPNQNCAKLLIKEALLQPGTHFKCKCPYCGEIVYINYNYRKGLEVI